MPLLSLKDNLPWLVPSAAILLASGYLDQFASQPEPPSTAQIEYAQPVSQGQPAMTASAAITSQDAVSRQDTTGLTSLTTVAPQPQPKPEPSVVAAVVPTPAVPKEEPEPTEIALASPETAAAFFAEAQANLNAQASCKEDLRSLASVARIYFPSGGLVADEGGMQQARLIGSIAENCKGVQIIVEGHSDASGDSAANLRLSKRRAEMVVQRIGASGVDTSNFIAKGLGEAVPSNVTGPQSSAFYDRRVEFAVLETGTPTRLGARQQAWGLPSCAAELQVEANRARLFFSPRSVAVQPEALQDIVQLASRFAACPSARMRVIGQHSDDLRSGESVHTGMLRAKALMAMLVGQGIAPEQIIIAAPSRAMKVPGQPGLSGSRVDFDMILEEG